MTSYSAVPTCIDICRQLVLLLLLMMMMKVGRGSDA